VSRSAQALDCERRGAFEHRCRQGHSICITRHAARYGLDPRVVAKACDDTDPDGAATHERARRAAQRVASESDGNITRFER
jgi:hypothetical protein